MKRTWHKKLADDKGLPKVGNVAGKMSRRWGTGTMVIPAAHEEKIFNGLKTSA